MQCLFDLGYITKGIQNTDLDYNINFATACCWSVLAMCDLKALPDIFNNSMSLDYRI